MKATALELQRLDHTTLEVQLVVTRELRVRIAVATALMRRAAAVLGADIRVEIAGDD